MALTILGWIVSLLLGVGLFLSTIVIIGLVLYIMSKIDTTLLIFIITILFSLTLLTILVHTALYT